MIIKNLKMVKSDDLFDYDLKITIKPCYKCNQMCWFCHEYDNSTAVWTKEQCDIVLDKLRTIPEDKKNIFVYIYGGEPTLCKYWEYLQHEILSILNDKRVFLQTQTNLSLKPDRLEKFLQDVKTKNTHTVDICTSYHLNKQSVEEFADKLSICKAYDCMGVCHFSTEIEHEEQMLKEFYYLERKFPGRIKLKFTQFKKLKQLNSSIYNKLLADPYLVGDDDGEQLEFRYLMRKYPEFENYLEDSWNFDVDSEIINYAELMNRGVHYKCKFMRCKAGTKNVVFNHDLKVYRCNDYFYSEMDPIDIEQLVWSEYLKRDIICMNDICTDGLDHEKYR